MARQGKNICVFGKGSKIQLLRRVQKEELSDYHAFHIKGYLPSVTEKKVFNHFGGLLIDVGYTPELSKVTIRDQLEEYQQILALHSNVNILIVLHSIDGPNLKNPESQERLAELIDIPQVQLICSVDDIRTVFNWSASTSSSPSHSAEAEAALLPHRHQPALRRGAQVLHAQERGQGDHRRLPSLRVAVAQQEPEADPALHRRAGAQQPHHGRHRRHPLHLPGTARQVHRIGN
jgi:hypothetical protein